ncbi:MAG: glycosyltransferase family 4 protein [Thermoleophilia bacterium]|nr:glycosyltransferase family 4 protein [Thermoleophilia bacterium]
MKVGIIVPYSWSYHGGVVEHAEQQARALGQLGIETRIIVGHDPPGPLTRMLHMRLGRQEHPPADVIPIGHTVVVPNNGSLANVIVSPAALFRFRRILAKEAFDILHLHEPAMPIPCVAALAVSQVPLVGTFHASGAVPLHGIARRLFGSMLERLDARIAVSSVARETAQKFFPGNYEIVPNGTPLPPEVDIGNRSNQVVFVGRHDRRKGLQVLFRAWPRVRALTGARLRVIGADPLDVGRLKARLGLQLDGIDLLGSISDRALTQELLAAKILVAPSLGNESFGMVLTRAFGCATPVIATDIPGYRTIVSPEAGRLVTAGDAELLADAVIEMLADERRRAACGAKARELAQQRYSWEQIAQRLAVLYERLLHVPQNKEAD